MRSFIAAELSVPGLDVVAMVLGGHGDTMVPLSRYTTVKGKPVSELLSKDRLEAIVKRTREGGAEIVDLLKTGSAFYAPSASVVDMIETIVKDQKRVLPCAVFCEGEYGLQDVVIGVPVRLGRGGAEQVVEYELTAEEQAALATSAGAVRDLCAAVDRLMA
jgi:malate dehydrogenase